MSERERGERGEREEEEDDKVAICLVKVCCTFAVVVMPDNERTKKTLTTYATRLLPPGEEYIIHPSEEEAEAVCPFFTRVLFPERKTGTFKTSTTMQVVVFAVGFHNGRPFIHTHSERAFNYAPLTCQCLLSPSPTFIAPSSSPFVIPSFLSLRALNTV